MVVSKRFLNLLAVLMRVRSLPLLTSLVPLALLAAACAAPRVTETVRHLTPNLSEERMLDLQVALILGDSATRRQARRADDLEGWLDAWWAQRDPSPGTPENEALLVYRARAKYLVTKFPGTPFGEWPLVWNYFLLYGPADQRGPDFVPWIRPEEAERQRTPSMVLGYLRERLQYGTPEPFQLIIDKDRLVKDPERKIPKVPPSLDGVWATLEDPASSVIERRQALTRLSWYELPMVAERLLAIPDSRWTAMPDVQQSAFTRLARRMAYQHPIEELRRLAAMGAAGAGPAGLMRRAAAPSYSAILFQADLQALSDRQWWLPRNPTRGPHPRLWTDPEGLLADLAQQYRDDDRMTGWDWRGDLNLAMGTPAFLDQRNRLAHYLWGTPEIYGIGTSMLGWVEAVRQEDLLARFVQDVERRDREQRAEADAAAQTLSRALGSSGGGGNQVTDSMLDQLQVLAPPSVFRVSLPENAPHIRLQIDVVAFPAGGDSVEVQASFGIPADDVSFRQTEQGWVTDLKCNLILVDRRLQVRKAMTRQEGYTIGGSGQITGLSFLDVFRFQAAPGSYIAYLSAEDPRTGRQGGVLVSVDLSGMTREGLRVSPILLAADISPAREVGKFTRGDLQILPIPSRQVEAGRDLWCYFELDNLARSDVGDYDWDETYYVIPDTRGEGIVRIHTDEQHTSLQPLARRNIALGLSGLAATYTGPVFLVVQAVDQVSGRQAIGATRFTLLPPVGPPPPGPDR